MATVRANCPQYMAPDTNFQKQMENEPAPPNFSNVNPLVEVSTEKTTQDYNLASLPQRRAYKQGFDHAHKLLVKKLRWEVVKPIVKTVKAMQIKIDNFMFFLLGFMS